MEVAARAGLKLDDWQKDVLVDACRVDRKGKWESLQVGVCVGRQNGKGAIIEARELAALFAWEEQMVVHSAQQFDTSLEAFRRLLFLIEDTPEFDREVKKVSNSHGEEGITLRDGTRIRYRTRSKASGRGFSGDLVFLDEAMFIATYAHAALFPIVSARDNPQVWYTGSAVDQNVHDHGFVFAEVRKNALEGRNESLAYFEWSLDFDTPGDVPEEVAADPAAWAEATPALGIRIREEYLAAELVALDSRSFAVERLGVGDWPDIDAFVGSPISPAEWNELRDPNSSMLDPVCFAFDVSPDRRSSIAAAGRRPDGLFHVEVVEHKAGTRWLVERLLGLQEHDNAGIFCDAYGPAASIVAAAAEAGVTVEAVNTADHGKACGTLLDLVGQQQLRHLGSNELTVAVRGARTRPLGDAWAWSRKNSSVDISPLVAATLALSAAAALPDGSSDLNIW